jgi:hypothetical protein
MASIMSKMLDLIFSKIEDPVWQRLGGLKRCFKMKF